MSYKFVYDVWGRLRMIKNQSNQLVEEYRYNGLNHRLSWHYDTDIDGDCDGSDKTYYFCYDDQWRIVATFRESDTSPKERFLYHAAGLGGRGGAYGGIGGYIDHVIFRDKDANGTGGGGWTAASDGTLEERMYYCQNWRADVSAILTSAGKMVEWIKYAAYGTPFSLPMGDTDSDGDWDLTDLGNMAGGYEVRKDTELDGDVDANDINYAITNGYQTLGRGVLSSSYVANRKGYAGYENDGAIVRLWHVRHRVLDSTLGRWTRRDPIGYVDGSSLYFSRSLSGEHMLDPTGTNPGIALLPVCRAIINIYNGGDGTPLENCCRWWNQNSDTSWTKQLPSCPCRIRTNPVRNPNPNTWDTPGRPACCHPGAAYCMRSLYNPAHTGAQQCCYDNFGNLITQGPGAGTPDIIPLDHPNCGLLGHHMEDLAPYYNCLEAGCWYRYIQRRPPNNARNCPTNPPTYTHPGSFIGACNCPEVEL